MKSPWSYERPTIEEFPYIGIWKSSEEMNEDLILYIEIMDDILSQPITGTSLWQAMKGVEYIGELR